MSENRKEALVRLIITKAKAFGADLAGVASVDDLKSSPSHVISEKMPEFEGEGTKAVKGRKRGIVEWPAGARSAVVISLAHPRDQPELDWWVTDAASGNTSGNRELMAIISKLAGWLEQKQNIKCFKLPYYIEYGAVYMKDAAILAGLGCIGKNNMLVTPEYGPRQRLRVMLTDADLPTTGKTDFDPCADCAMPCWDVCPRDAFAETIYTEAEYCQTELPGRSGIYNRVRCNQQMDIDNAAYETIRMEGRDNSGKRVRYCRKCEMVCPVGLK